MLNLTLFLKQGLKTLFLLFIFILIQTGTAWSMDLHAWNDSEKAILKSLWIVSLPPIPDNPSNKYSADPMAVSFGKKLFFDNRLSGNLKVSCATCHPPNMNFADNLPLAHGMGTTTRRTMPLVGAAYYTWLFWDGRKDSLWAQALGPIESAVEHGFTRTQCASIIIQNYRKDYEMLFGTLPEFSKRDLPPLAKPSLDEPSALKAWVSMPREKKDAVNQIYANMGKAIAAFVRTIVPSPARFDEYVQAVMDGDPSAMMKAMTNDEVKGLRLFMGKAKCTNCHSGPLFTNGEFHNIGLLQPENLPPDNGRSDAIAKVLADEFNCLSVYSDAKRSDCAELRFIDTATYKYIGAFKTPTLRNVAERAPYMHAGQIPTLQKVLEFYRDLKPDKRSADLEHGDLNDLELKQLEAFLRTLSSPLKFAE
jgi:cytochrome c peroxidase